MIESIARFRNSLTQEILNKYPISVIRCALIRHWLNINGFADFDLQNLNLADNLFVTDEKSGSLLTKQLQAIFPSYTLKELETSLETLLEYQDKRNSGTVLTPSFIIDYLIKSAAGFFSEGSKAIPRICDPACGYAGFLVPAVQFLSSVYSISPKEAVTKYIFGYDVNPISISLAQTMLALNTLSMGQDPTGLQYNIHCIDTLLENPINNMNLNDRFSGFDVLITNPPYIKLQNLLPEYREKLQGKYPEYSIGSFSTAMLFLISGYRLLSPEGCLGYITQNNIFTSLAGVPVRKFLSDSECLKRIIDFGSTKIFDNASAYTCLIFAASNRSKSFEYGRIAKNVNTPILQDVRLSSVLHNSLNSSKWRLVPSEHKDNTKRLESIGTPLGVLCSLRVGFATLKDKVYFVRKVGDNVVGQSDNGKERIIENEVTRPAIKIAEFNNESELLTNTRRIIFPYEKINGKYKPISEHSLMEKYPNCYDYLVSWKETLATRDKGKKSIEPWFAWGRSQALEAPGPKLLTKTFSNHPNFMLDESDSLFCNGYSVFIDDHNKSLFTPKYPIKVIQAIINSVVMDYYLRLTSFQIEGDYQCYQKNFIERFSIPLLDENEMNIVLSLQGTERDRFLCEKYSLDYSEVLDFLVEYTLKSNGVSGDEC